MTEAQFSEELEAQLSQLISGEISLEGQEGQRILRSADLPKEHMEELCAIYGALEFYAVVREARETPDASGADLVDRVLRDAASAGLPSAEPSTAEAQPPVEVGRESTRGKAITQRSRGAWLLGGLLAAAALGMVLLSGVDDGKGVDLTQKYLGTEAQGPAPWIIEGLTARIPHDLQAGQLVDVVIERWVEPGSWEQLLEKSSQGGALEFNAAERSALEGPERVRLRAWLISADGSRSPLYSGPLVLK